MLKATAGGGGRGMRVVGDAGELPRAFAGATAEAEASFKDGRVYMERLVRSPRHVEVQVLGDGFGNIVHVGERDCSVQKPSHQKIIEETPAPNLAPARVPPAQDGVARVPPCRLHQRGNARVPGRRRRGVLHGDEHANSGRAPGNRDGVQHRSGQRADPRRGRRAARIRQRDLASRGHAIECRINAEDPHNNFAPAAGLVSKIVFPGGPGIRVDTHLYAGAQSRRITTRSSPRSSPSGIPAKGDPRMERALRETLITGVATTLGLCLRSYPTPSFRSGHYDIEFLPRGSPR